MCIPGDLAKNQKLTHIKNTYSKYTYYTNWNYRLHLKCIFYVKPISATLLKTEIKKKKMFVHNVAQFSILISHTKKKKPITSTPVMPTFDGWLSVSRTAAVLVTSAALKPKSISALYCRSSPVLFRFSETIQRNIHIYTHNNTSLSIYVYMYIINKTCSFRWGMLLHYFFFVLFVPQKTTMSILAATAATRLTACPCLSITM